MQDTLVGLFIEAFFSRTLWQLTSEVRYFAMFEFGETDMLMPSLIAILGGTLAGFANSLVGRGLAIFQERGELNLTEEKYERAQLWGNRLVWLIGFLSWYWIGAIFLFAAGFLRVSHWKVILATLTGQVVFYGYYYLLSTGQITSIF